jgi:branched-subunit amino acid ABC-type transport system permease component
MLVIQILINSLVIGTQVLLLAAGLYLIQAVTKTYHIALGAIATAGAYTYYVLYGAGLSGWVALAAGLAGAGLISWLSFFLLRKYIDASQDLLALLSSLTLGVAMEALMGIIFGPEGRFLTKGVLPVYQLAGLHITKVGLWTIILGGVAAVSAFIFLYLLPWGRLIRAVAQHRPCAAIMGINENRVRQLVYLAAGLLAGAVGILSAMNNSVSPGAGLHPVITAFIALLVGGIGDFRGTVIASYLLVLIPEMIVSLGGGAVNFSVTWKMVFVFLLALFLLILRPQGLFSSINRQT